MSSPQILYDDVADDTTGFRYICLMVLSHCRYQFRCLNVLCLRHHTVFHCSETSVPTKVELGVGIERIGDEVKPLMLCFNNLALKSNVEEIPFACYGLLIRI